MKESKEQEGGPSPSKKKNDNSKTENEKKKSALSPKQACKKKTNAKDDGKKNGNASGIKKKCLNSKTAGEEITKAENNSIIDYINLSAQFDTDETSDLVSTGKHVVEATNIVEEFHDGQQLENNNKLPVPPPEVLSFFKLMQKPVVQRFISSFCHHFDTDETEVAVHDSHQCYEDIQKGYHQLKPASHKQEDSNYKQAAINDNCDYMTQQEEVEVPEFSQHNIGYQPQNQHPEQQYGQKSILTTPSMSNQQYIQPQDQHPEQQYGQKSVLTTPSMSNQQYIQPQDHHPEQQYGQKSVLTTPSMSNQQYIQPQDQHTEQRSVQKSVLTTPSMSNQQYIQPQNQHPEQQYVQKSVLTTPSMSNQQYIQTQNQHPEQQYLQKSVLTTPSMSNQQYIQPYHQYIPKTLATPQQNHQYEQPTPKQYQQPSDENVNLQQQDKQLSQSQSANAEIHRRLSPKKLYKCTSEESGSSSITQQRRSPRKTVNNDQYVKLVESASFTVKSDLLRNITNKAKREKNPGYFLVIKLMPMVFKTEEMANSRGQGLRPAKTGDIRPPLDADKIKTVKVYAEGFCRKHSYKQASDSEMNDAISECIAYARKKLKRQIQK